ncbi:MAG: dienelactone hydrolase family protein [Pseudomonadota bacterium]
MTTLTGPRLAAANGTTSSLVVLLHGYGADGADLIGLGDALAPHLPGTTFLAPNAPQRCAVNPGGYQWFSIPWMDGSSEADMTAGMTASAAAIDAYLDALPEAEGVAPAQTVVVGFSQGTMMSLEVVPRRADPVAGIIGFSGRLLDGARLPAEIKSRPPVLLIHGDADEVVPAQHLPEAAEGLRAAGVTVETHISPGIGHGIAPDGLQKALAFMQAHLG